MRHTSHKPSNKMHAHLLAGSALLIASILPQTLRADDEIRDQFNPVRTAVTSLSIAPDARSGGMGDVGVATDPDVNSQYWNPAKYPFNISRAGFAINYTPWLRKLTSGIALLNASGYVRLGDYQALSASLRYFTLGEFTVSGNESMSVKPYELSVDAATHVCLARSSRPPLHCATFIQISTATTTTTPLAVLPLQPTLHSTTTPT